MKYLTKISGDLLSWLISAQFLLYNIELEKNLGTFYKTM